MDGLNQQTALVKIPHSEICTSLSIGNICQICQRSSFSTEIVTLPAFFFICFLGYCCLGDPPIQVHTACPVQQQKLRLIGKRQACLVPILPTRWHFFLHGVIHYIARRQSKNIIPITIHILVHYFPTRRQHFLVIGICLSVRSIMRWQALFMSQASIVLFLAFATRCLHLCCQLHRAGAVAGLPKESAAADAQRLRQPGGDSTTTVFCLNPRNVTLW